MTVTISGTDTSLLTWPTKDRVGGNLDLTRAYVFVGSVDWWLPVSSWPAGVTTTITSQATNFDPTGVSGNSNYGAGFQPGFEAGATCSPSSGNCTLRTLDNTTPVLKNPSFDGQFRAILPLYTPLPGGTSSRSGDSPFFRGQTGEWVFTDNHQGIAQTGVTLCAKWDPVFQRITDNASAGGNQPALMPTNLEYGAIVYPDDAARKNSGCGIAGDGAIGWFPSITAAGGPSAVTAVRATQTTQIVQGQGLNLVLRTTRTSADLPVGSPIPMFYSYYSDQLGNIASSYNPTANSGLGQRGRAADVRTSVKLAWNPTTAASPGQSRELIVTPSITAPNELTTRTAENASIRVTLPSACMKYKPGSASIAPASITAANFGPDGIPCSGDDGAGQTLTWNLGNIAISSPSGTGLAATIAAIKLLVDFDYGIPSPATYTETGVISATNSIDVAGFRTATTSINSVSLTGFSVNKTADRANLYPGLPVNYTISWNNPSAASLGTAKVVDLLPYIGDGRSTANFGSLNVGTVAPIVQSNFSNDVTIEYTTDSPSAVKAALVTDQSGDTGITWSSAKPSASISAVRFIIADLAAAERGAATVQLTPSQVASDTVLGNSLWGRAGALSLESQGLTVLSAALSSVAGTVYTDTNYSGDLSAGDARVVNKTISLTGYSFGANGLNEAGSGDDVTLTTPRVTTTNSLGEYLFTDLLPGSYSISSATPTGQVLTQSTPTPFIAAASTALTNYNLGYQVSLAPPIAVNDTVVTAINSAITIPILSNDTVDGGGTISAVGDPTSGMVTRNSSMVTFTPVFGMTGTSVFTYTVKNLQGQTATASVTVNIIAPPVARKDSASTRKATPVTINALSNDTGTGIGLNAVGSSPNGTASIVSGQIVFTPNATFSGTTSVSYSIIDPAGQISTSSISVVVTESPVAKNDTRKVTINGSIDVDVLTNDSGTAIVVSQVSAVVHGAANIKPDGTVSYTPDANYVGTGSFSYEIIDTTGETSAATVTMAIIPKPVARNDNAHTGIGDSNGQPVVIDILGNDDGDLISITALSAPAHGTISQTLAGDIIYTPDGIFVGVDTFNYTITDSVGQTSSALVSIAVKMPPVAVGDLKYTPKNQPITVDVLANDLGITPTVTSLGSGTNGVALLNPDHTITFTPDAGFTGSATVPYIIEDAYGQSESGVLTIKMLDAPTALDDSTSTPKATAVVISVLANDVATGKSVTANTSPTNGTVTFNSAGVATFTPSAGFTGVDTFTYTMADAAGQSATAFVTVTVVGPPEASDDSASTHVGTSVTKGVLANDVGSSLIVTNVSSSLNFTTTINADNTITFAPAAGFAGTETFTYTVTDYVGQNATAKVSVKVIPFPTAPEITFTVGATKTHTFNPVTSPATGSGLTLSASNPSHGTAKILSGTTEILFTPTAGSTSDFFTYSVTDEMGYPVTGNVYVTVIPAPDANDDSVSTAYATPISVSVLANDTADVKDVTGHTNPGHGTVAFDSSDVATYTPAVGFAGTDSFEYTITDSQGQASTATVNITVQATDAPIANGTSITIAASSSHKFDLISLTQATKPTLVSVTQPSSGSVVQDAAQGTATFTAAAVTARSVTAFTYTIKDELGRTATATIDVIVLQPVDAVNDSVSTALATAVTITPLINDAGFQPNITSIGAVPNGSVSRSGNTLTFTPSAGFVGNTTFTYTIEDSIGQRSTATIAVQVTSNPAPTADNMYLVSAMGALSTLTPLTHSTGTGLAVTLATTPAHGNAIVLADGKITYTPAASWFGTETFTYRVTDSIGQTAIATIQINVIAAPVTVDDRITVASNTAGTVAVLGNDIGTSLNVISVGSVAGWQIRHTASNVSFTPAPGFTGVIVFVYTVQDSVGQRVNGKIFVTVTSDSGFNTYGGGSGAGNGGGNGTGNGTSFLTSRLAYTGTSGSVPTLGFLAASFLIVLGVVLARLRRR